MLNKVFIPYKGYWSSPFCKWQMSLQHENAIKCGSASAKRFFELRGISPEIFDGIILGITVSQKDQFFSSPYFATLMGNDRISGPTVSQACATSATCIAYAGMAVESGAYQNVFVPTTDRCSNGPNTIWANPKGPGGQPEYESWMMDGFSFDPASDCSALQTAEIVGKEHGVTKEDADAMTVSRYEKYMESLLSDRAFQKRYMQPIEIRVSKKKTIMIEEDEGISPTTAEGLKKLKPLTPDGIHSFGAQTHAADGNAGMIITTSEKATELSFDKNITIQLLSYGYARAEKAHMAAAVPVCAEKALGDANIKVSDLAAVKTHNPFAVNDVVMGKTMGIDEKIFNNYGSSLIFGHPQGPTGMRLTIELIEELVMKGGGYGLFAGCAAGDCAAGLVVKVN